MIISTDPLIEYDETLSIEEQSEECQDWMNTMMADSDLIIIEKETVDRGIGKAPLKRVKRQVYSSTEYDLEVNREYPDLNSSKKAKGRTKLKKKNE